MGDPDAHLATTESTAWDPHALWTCLFRLYGCPSWSSPEVFVPIIAEHGARQRHELEVGCDLADVAQDEVDLLLSAVESLTDLCAGGFQLTPEEQRRGVAGGWKGGGRLISASESGARTQ